MSPFRGPVHDESHTDLTPERVVRPPCALRAAPVKDPTSDGDARVKFVRPYGIVLLGMAYDD
ncbi:hypothetical protein SCAB_59882 [Streptomyces scabiei 87.22]|uniref:Uncharacterized protein n=1 Tax=Streptomyces scabiei (strain 87.22) TaxID=680198 RepID=C9Z7E3_STRSW|nr:hypothetical protein SCAB_59882 [Streptomyces scabiei 87.22]